MTPPHIHGRYRTIPATMLLEQLGQSLTRIKGEDGATDADLGQVLGKSDDRAAAYRAGAADMGVVSFLRGCREWDGRFANDVLALIGMRLVPLEIVETPGSSLPALGALIGKKAIALADGHIDDRELDDMWPEIEAVGRHIDRLRARRAVRLTQVEA